MRLNAKMSKADPLTETRRQRFRAYCKRNGWFDEGRQRWMVTEIAKATGKPVNKVSDLLNGSGSFGAKIAREIEDYAEGLAQHELDSPLDREPEQPKEETPMQPFEQERRPTVAEAVEALAEALLGLNETGRKLAEPYLQTVLTDPMQAADMAAELQRLVDNRSKKRSPATPTPPKGGKSKGTTQSAAKTPAKAQLTVKPGGGEKRQLELALRRLSPTARVSPNPFREESATESERGWYQSLKMAPKADGGR